MRRTIASAVIWCACAAFSVAQQIPTPIFRTDVDLVQIDVSVLDKQRHPVLGLTATDFSVTIDGEPRPVVAFKAVTLPVAAPPTAAWMRDIASDIATNTRPAGRVIVILIDDGGFAQTDSANRQTASAARTIDVADGWTRQNARTIAKTVVDQMGPDDLAAVVYTQDNRTAQAFTRDRARLLAAINGSTLNPGTNMAVDAAPPAAPSGGSPVGGTMNDPDANGMCYCGVCSIEAIERVSDALRSLPQQRKIILYVSVGRVVRPAGMAVGCNELRRDAMNNAFKAAQLANVTIDAVDPKGLVVGQVGMVANQSSPTLLRTEFLRTVAENTGGRAVVNRNDAVREIPALLEESGSYYLLGVERPVAKNTDPFHPIRVRVGRSGLIVRSRTGYYSSATNKHDRVARTGPDAALMAALPMSDFPLDVALAPFADGRGHAELRVVLNVTPPDMAGGRTLDLLATAVNPESGDAVDSWRQTVTVTPTLATGPFEVQWGLPVSTGRYELRLGVEAADGRRSSVYADVAVPDFARDDLSLSGLIVSATPTIPTVTASIPTEPTATARRSFRADDHVVAFLRVYEGGSRPVAPITIVTRLLEARDQQVAGSERVVQPPAFTSSRSVDHEFVIPPHLSTGDYVLIVDVSAGGRTLRRAVPFQVK